MHLILKLWQYWAGSFVSVISFRRFVASVAMCDFIKISIVHRGIHCALLQKSWLASAIALDHRGSSHWQIDLSLRFDDWAVTAVLVPSMMPLMPLPHLCLLVTMPSMSASSLLSLLHIFAPFFQDAGALLCCDCSGNTNKDDGAIYCLVKVRSGDDLDVTGFGDTLLGRLVNNPFSYFATPSLN